MNTIKAIFIPGNGGGGPMDNWFPYLARELSRMGITVIAESFPDSFLARSEFWLPHITNLGADEQTILIGHSSGAIAAMRYAETHRILGSILVGAYHTDLGIDTEKQSGYFDKPWDFSAIKNNQNWIGLFAGKNDPWIPVAEARFLNEQLDPYYFEFPHAGHFGGDYFKETFPEIITFIQERLPTPVIKPQFIKEKDQKIKTSLFCGEIKLVVTNEDHKNVDIALLHNMGPTKAHVHRHFSEIYLLLDGESEVELVVDNKVIREKIKANEAVVIPPNTPHKVVSISEHNRLCVVSVPIFDADDESLVDPDFSR